MGIFNKLNHFFCLGEQSDDRGLSPLPEIKLLVGLSPLILFFFVLSFFFLLSPLMHRLQAQETLGEGKVVQTHYYDPAGQIKVTALPAGINSPDHDFSPTVSGDNRILIFNSNRPGGVGQSDLYEARWINDRWSNPRNLVEINTPFIDETPHISADGRTLIFSSNRPGSLNRTSDLYISFRQGDRWSEAQPLQGGVNSIYSEKAPSLSPDGKYLMFTRYPSGNIGQAQIFLAIRQSEGVYTRAQALPQPININAMDSCPVFHPKGFGLFFSSFRDGKSWDIYWGPFQEDGSIRSIEKLPLEVNTPSMEAFFSITADGTKIYFSRLVVSDTDNQFSLRTGLEPTKQQKMHYDIFEVSFSKIMQQLEKKAEPLKISIFDKNTNKPLSARVRAVSKFNDNKNTKKIREQKTAHSMLLPSMPGQKWQIDVGKNGYLPFHGEVVHEAGKNEIRIFLKPVEQGQAIVLPKIEFSPGRAILTPQSKKSLEHVFEFLQQNPTLRVELSGHTDNRGSADYNQGLSLERARAVRDYLVIRGIGKDRLLARGFGMSKPIDSNQTESGRKRNRRTELKILSK